jgi:quinol monooxygenase YgiN
MISITAKFRVKAAHIEDWPNITKAFTEATRAEPGCLWFEWSQSQDDAAEFVLVEAFVDTEAGAAHVSSDHFKRAQQELPGHLVETPRIVHFNDPEISGWSPLGELAVVNSDEPEQ